jgi:hypothetical protein
LDYLATFLPNAISENPVSQFAFKFNLYRYNTGPGRRAGHAAGRASTDAEAAGVRRGSGGAVQAEIQVTHSLKESAWFQPLNLKGDLLVSILSMLSN